MEYLLTYLYSGKQNGISVSGQGSAEMSMLNTNKITPEVIKNGIEWVRADMESKGYRVDAICPMGWFKYDDESEDET